MTGIERDIRVPVLFIDAYVNYRKWLDHSEDIIPAWKYPAPSFIQKQVFNLEMAKLSQYMHGNDLELPTVFASNILRYFFSPYAPSLAADV